MFLVRPSYELPPEQQLYSCLSDRNELLTLRVKRTALTQLLVQLAAQRLGGKTYYPEALKASTLEVFRDLPLHPKLQPYNPDLLGQEAQPLFDAVVNATIACATRRQFAAWN